MAINPTTDLKKEVIGAKAGASLLSRRTIVSLLQLGYYSIFEVARERGNSELKKAHLLVFKKVFSILQEYVIPESSGAMQKQGGQQ